MDEKKILREQIISLRNSLLEEERKKRSLQIVQNIESSEVFKKASSVLFYAPFRNEVDLLSLAEQYLSFKKICFPLVVEKELIITKVSSLKDLSQGSFGILEPDASLPEISKSDINLVLVPCVGIDIRGNRLGYGGGFYDRFLADYLGEKMGVVYDFQRVDELPVSAGDIPLSSFVSEKGVSFY